ncbi:hypothetical protein BaRGS_00034235 [Batillaria attramentaria]|uniref:Uncharacterized protein n=1 Tax=Batillaria attramentaria TaxID=370345 RepID=A0ABD0JIM3_9CAEN
MLSFVCSYVPGENLTVCFRVESWWELQRVLPVPMFLGTSWRFAFESRSGGNCSVLSFVCSYVPDGFRWSRDLMGSAACFVCSYVPDGFRWSRDLMGSAACFVCSYVLATSWRFAFEPRSG